jgi:hypothetical protein
VIVYNPTKLLWIISSEFTIARKSWKYDNNRKRGFGHPAKDWEREREREREREKDTKCSWKVGAAVAILSLGSIMVACCVSCGAGENSFGKVGSFECRCLGYLFLAPVIAALRLVTLLCA